MTISVMLLLLQIITRILWWRLHSWGNQTPMCTTYYGGKGRGSRKVKETFSFSSFLFFFFPSCIWREVGEDGRGLLSAPHCIGIAGCGITTQCHPKSPVWSTSQSTAQVVSIVLRHCWLHYSELETIHPRSNNWHSPS